MTNLRIGQPAPDFTLSNQNDEEISLSDYRKKTLYYFSTRRIFPQDVLVRLVILEIAMKILPI